LIIKTSLSAVASPVEQQSFSQQAAWMLANDGEGI
jgi:hypothetical protein